MWRLLFLSLILLLHIKDVVSENCTTGYTDIGNGICQSGKSGPAAQYLAYASCAAQNAYMPTVSNGFDNTKVASIASGNIWLGLTCTSSQATSCLWDNGVSITNGSYSNFYPGHPNISIGACVYMSSYSSQWYSSDCTQNTSPYFVCRTSPGVYVPKCDSPSYYFRGHCYYSIYYGTYGKSVAPCNANCGNIASIHNDGENSYVRDIAFTKTITAYTYIGLTYQNGTFQWDDGTQLNFDNFGFKNINLGTCVLLATVSGDVVPQGQWVSTDCNGLTVAVCKRDIICPITTQAPPQCTDIQYLSGGGDLLSPNYPLGSGPNHCQYIITEDSGLTISFSIQELNLDGSSTIKIYNSMLDTIPFVIFNGSSQANNGTSYFAAGNFLRILFDTPGNIDFKNQWRIRYATHVTGPDHCGSTFSTSPEVISGPHSALNCTYSLRMGATTGRTCIKLSSLDVRKSDSIAIYDGAISSDNQIGFFNSTVSSRYVTKVALCTTTSNYMTIVTSGYSGLGYEMFVLTAADSPEILAPQILGLGYSLKAVPCSAQQYYSGNQQSFLTDFYTNEANKTVKAVLTQLYIPDPHYLLIMDGDSTATVALAYGSLINSRMTYQSSKQRLGLFVFFNSGGSNSAGFVGSFSAV